MNILRRFLAWLIMPSSRIGVISAPPYREPIIPDPFGEIMRPVAGKCVSAMTINREPCPHCTYNNWREVPIFKQINPNGEYVEGYGHTPVLEQSGSDWICNACGWKEGGNPTIIILDSESE